MLLAAGCPVLGGRGPLLPAAAGCYAACMCTRRPSLIIPPAIMHAPMAACSLQDNQICTIRGSLARFQFLHKLDLSNNQLSDLEQVLKGLSRLGHLTHLNLKVCVIVLCCRGGGAYGTCPPAN